METTILSHDENLVKINCPKCHSDFARLSPQGHCTDCGEKYKSRDEQVTEACQYIAGIAGMNYSRADDAQDIVSMVKIRLLKDWQPSKGASAKTFAVMAYKQSRTSLARERVTLSCSIATINKRIANGFDAFDTLQATSLDLPLTGHEGESGECLQSTISNGEPTPAELLCNIEQVEAIRAIVVQGFPEFAGKVGTDAKLRALWQAYYVEEKTLHECAVILNCTMQRCQQLNQILIKHIAEKLREINA